MKIELCLDDGIGLGADNYVCEEVNMSFPPPGNIGFLLRQTELDYNIRVRSRDNGQEPHFHILDKSTDGNEFNARVGIECAVYFKHNGINGRLDSKGKKLLNRLMNKTIKYQGKSITNWERIVKAWDESSERRRVNAPNGMPCYLDLPNKED